jgi:transcription initiation protein SPT3
MFVFGEVQDPNAETVNLIEDIVRSQLIELVNLHILLDYESQ